jgi:transposase
MRKFWIGIDVSKKTLDLTLLTAGGEVLARVCIANSSASLEKLWKQWSRKFKIKTEEVLVCLEPTGHYSYVVLFALDELSLPTWQAHPTDILKSIGNTRGKTDEVDAYRIAEYARRFNDKARLVTKEFLRTLKLKQLITRRESLVKSKLKHESYLRDLNKYIDESIREECISIDMEQLVLIKAHIKKVEKLIKQLISSVPEWHEQYKLLLSVDGIGKVGASHLIAITDGFTRFTDPRELACHAGFAPFPTTSGTSIRGKTKTSKQSHKGLKTVLHMGAKSVIQRKGDLQTYYERKVAEGKKKISVLHAVANKIIHRACAVIARGTPYVGHKTSKAA